MPNTFQFKLTHKILLLVGMLSGLALMTTLYSLNNMHKVDKNYRYLLEHKTQNTLIISDALVDLSDASRIAFSVLTEQEEQQMRVSQHKLLDQQVLFVSKLNTISTLSEQQNNALVEITDQQEHLFGLINEVINQAARWRGDRALIIIHGQLEPALNELRLSMDQLRESILDDYLNTSKQLAETTQDTIINTALAVGLTLILAISLASFLSYAHISRPITRLTYVMSRLSDRQYDYPISYQQRNDEVGRMAQALHIFRDNMKRADHLELEAASSKENKRLSEQLVALTDAMPGAVFQLRINKDDSRQFLFLSSKAESFLEHPIESLLNRSFASDEFVFPASSAFQWIIKKAFERSRQTLKPIDTDIRVERDQQVFWYKILATCQPSDDFSTVFNGILLDISTSKYQAQALEVAKNSAEQAARTKAAFLTTMSHEIRTPMNAILGLTQLMLKYQLSDDQHQRLTKISSAGHHLLNIINDILDFSKIDGHHLELEHIPFEPSALLTNTVQMLTDDAQKKGLTLHIDVDPELPKYLVGDPTRIGQILLNYLNNAIKFSESGAIYIRIRLKPDNAAGLQLYCEVEDQGIGISADNIGNLFKEFQQADASITRRFGGTGLGLAISRKLAKLMGGDVGAQSKEGQGSTFWFTIAVAAYTKQQAFENTKTHSIDIEPPARFKGLRILLVDDNELNRLVGKEILETAGFIVDLANDGQQAIDHIIKVDKRYYSAVLMDIMMPVLDGISATQKLRSLAEGKDLPIIAVSANTSVEDTQRYTAAGINAYISKPIDEQQLWQTLEQHISQVSTLMRSSRQSPAPAEEHFNQQHLQTLHKSMGDTRFIDLLNKLITDYQTRLSSITQLDTTVNTSSIKQHLHDLISTAGHAGFHQLSRLALDLNNALHNNEVERIIELQSVIEETLHSTITYLQEEVSRLKTK